MARQMRQQPSENDNAYDGTRTHAHSSRQEQPTLGIVLALTTTYLIAEIVGAWAYW